MMGDPRWNGGFMPRQRPNVVGVKETAALLDNLVTENGTFEEFATVGKALLDVYLRAGDEESAREVHRAITALIERQEKQIEEQRRGSNVPTDKAETDGLLIYKPEDFEEGSYIPDAKVAPLLARLVTDIRNATRYRDHGIEIPNRAFFVGPPGTGKTAASWYLAHQLGRPLVVAPLDAMKSKFVSQTQRNIAAACKVAQDNGNAVLFLDEADTLFPRRDKVSMSEEGSNTTGAFLQRSTLLSKDAPDLLIVLASNLAELIDPAIRGRVTTHIVFENPDVETRSRIIDRLWRKLDVDADARAWLIDRTADRSGRYLHLLAHDAGRAAIADDIVGADEGTVRVTIAHVRKALLLAAPQEELGKPAVRVIR